MPAAVVESPLKASDAEKPAGLRHNRPRRLKRTNHPASVVWLGDPVEAGASGSMPH